jgi:hypothetical protein
MNSNLFNFSVRVGKHVILDLIDGYSILLDLSFLQINILSTANILKSVKLLLLLVIFNQY